MTCQTADWEWLSLNVPSPEPLERGFPLRVSAGKESIAMTWLSFPRAPAVLWSPCGRIVSPSFEQLMNGFPFARVGEVCEEQRLTITGFNGNTVVDADIWELKNKWQQPLGI